MNQQEIKEIEEIIKIFQWVDDNYLDETVIYIPEINFKDLTNAIASYIDKREGKS